MTRKLTPEQSRWPHLDFTRFHVLGVWMQIMLFHDVWGWVWPQEWTHCTLISYRQLLLYLQCQTASCSSNNLLQMYNFVLSSTFYKWSHFIYTVSGIGSFHPVQFSTQIAACSLLLLSNVLWPGGTTLLPAHTFKYFAVVSCLGVLMKKTAIHIFIQVCFFSHWIICPCWSSTSGLKQSFKPSLLIAGPIDTWPCTLVHAQAFAWIYFHFSGMSIQECGQGLY